MGYENHDITRRRSPAYTMLTRDKGFYSSGRPGTLGTGPGPATYTLPPVMGYKNHDNTRRRNPAYTIGSKIRRFFSKRRSNN
jgi:hypothetical protein